MTKPGGESQPITEERYWMHITSGWVWREDRFHRNHVVLRRVRPTGRHPEIRMYRPQDDPGTGAAILGAPYWIRTAKTLSYYLNNPELQPGDLGPPEDEVTGVTDEDRIVMQVEEYVQAATGQKGSPTIQARRIIKALRLIGVPRSNFRVRTEINSKGEYGVAHGSLYLRDGCRTVIANADLLRRCGLNVHVISTERGFENAFVATPLRGPAVVIRHATVASRT